MIGSLSLFTLVIATGANSPAMSWGPSDDPPVRIDDVIAQAIRMAELQEAGSLKVTTLVDLAKVQARLGRMEAARETFRSAERATGEMRGEGGFFHLWVARGQAVAGFADEARDNRRRGIEWARNSPAAGSRLAVAAMRSGVEGDLDGAEEITGALRDGTAEERIAALGAIATEAARIGDLDRAHAAIAGAEAEVGRAKEEAKTSRVGPTYLSILGAAEAKVAIAEARAGHDAEARARIARTIATVDEVPAGSPSRPAILARLAPAHRALGDAEAAGADVERAVRIVRGEEPKLQTRAAALARLAVVLATDGERDAARGLIDEAIDLTDPGEIASAPSPLIEALVDLNELDEARKLLDSTSFKPAARATALRQLSRAEARSGDREARRALDRAESETDPEPRAAALVGVAEGLADREVVTDRP